ncbi:vacuolar H+ ATPase, putative [Ixodes scapularis]|uniref:Vacuolar H+ ATPase, putative n=1 Tax=Ixodes scapularis TaxID=6945 RepID=B7Q0Q6_IXOSC|nr:vacuolar H+ ATPase, putative [Ixodes scapularis]|eukprot:XP_002408166.1 vacuolar H+ ATPase, putative [Ixodes scapularis]
MGLDPRLLYSATGFWLSVAVLSPCLVPRTENRGVVRCMLVCAAVCTYLFWLCTYLAQIYPLVGPVLDARFLMVLERNWLPGQLEGRPNATRDDRASAGH